MPKIPKYSLEEAKKIVREQGLRTMSIEELKAVGSPMMKVVKERLKRLEKSGFTNTPAYRAYVKDKGMKASVRGNNRNVLVHEVYEAYRFLSTETKTSTVSGARESVARMEDILGKGLTAQQINDIFDIYHAIEDRDPYAFQKYGYDQILKIASNAAKTDNFDVDEAIARAQRTLAEMDMPTDSEMDEMYVWYKENYGEVDEWSDVMW